MPTVVLQPYHSQGNLMELKSQLLIERIHHTVNEGSKQKNLYNVEKLALHMSRAEKCVFH